MCQYPFRLEECISRNLFAGKITVIPDISLCENLWLYSQFAFTATQIRIDFHLFCASTFLKWKYVEIPPSYASIVSLHTSSGRISLIFWFPSKNCLLLKFQYWYHLLDGFQNILVLFLFLNIGNHLCRATNNFWKARRTFPINTFFNNTSCLHFLISLKWICSFYKWNERFHFFRLKFLNCLFLYYFSLPLMRSANAFLVSYFKSNVIQEISQIATS